MRWGILVVTTCVSMSVSNLGCGGGECGLGTVRFGNTCVAVDPFDKQPPRITIDPPLYTREVGTVRLTSDEPATIYYTIDGAPPTLDSSNEPDEIVIPNVPDSAQVRLFAVDLAGNVSDEESRIWIIDRAGPPAPLDFRVAVSGANRTVTWTPPSDPRYGGMIVARVEGQLTAGPLSGESYAVGDTLAPGVTIVELAGPGGATTFAETMPAVPGLIRYVAWAYDDIYNYGPPASDYSLVAVPPQVGTVNVDAGAGTVTVAGTPSYLTVSGTAELNGSTLTVALSIRNDTTRVLFAPKLLLTNTPAGVTWSNPDGALDTLPYRAYGGALPPGTPVSKTWTFTGASAATTFSLTFDLRDNPVLTATLQSVSVSGEVVDVVTGESVQLLRAGPRGDGGNAMTQGGGITPDGRLVVGARMAGVVSSFDLAFGNRLLSTTLRPQKSHVPLVTLDRTGLAAYAFVAVDHPNRAYDDGGGSPTELVRLDTATLTENGRIDVGTSRNRCAALSPDGRTLIAATGLTQEGIIVIDLGTFEIKQRLTPPFRAQCALFTPDGSSIVAVGEQVAIYNAAELTLDQMWTTPGTNGKVMRVAFESPNLLWIGRKNELGRIDLRDGTGEVFPTVSSVRMLDIFDDKVYVGGSNDEVSRLDLTGAVELTLPGFTDLRGHWIGRSPF